MAKVVKVGDLFAWALAPSLVGEVIAIDNQEGFVWYLLKWIDGTWQSEAQAVFEGRFANGTLIRVEPDPNNGTNKGAEK